MSRRKHLKFAFGLAVFGLLAAGIVLEHRTAGRNAHTSVGLNARRVSAESIVVQSVPIWTFKEVRVSANWPNATARRGLVNERGGEVELSINGTKQYYCPPSGVEHVLFKWSFNRDITRLRMGEDIEITLHVQPVSHDNICTGQLASVSELMALTSNSAGYTEAESPLYEDRIAWKTGTHAHGRTPEARNAVSVLTVSSNPNLQRNKVRFTIRLGGPCDHPQPWTCGYISYQYDYDLNTRAGGAEVTLENNINRSGGDYRNFALPEAKPELCRDACANDPRCRAYTYVRPHYQGPNARCWLKNSAPNGSSNACCISGVKQ